ncbi:MAG TPA: carbohydrate ABC transporter permease [Actinomycetes bacterium]|nr:carbohydrate ABC transporter permease [Actinomycetes bacterium]
MTTTGTTPPPTPVPGEVKPRRAQPRRGAAGAPGAGTGASPIVRIVLLVICFLWLVPTIGIIVTSFRTPDAALTSGWWTVITSPLDFTQYTITNYREAWSAGMNNSFINSFAVTLPATIIPIMIAAFAAYAFTFMEFPFRDTLFVVIVGLLVVPNQVALVPLLRLYSDVNLTGQFAAVYLAHIGFGMPLAIYILRNYMSTLPKAVIESAKIDGASHFKTFWRLIVPMSVPALASFAIFQFLWVWNDLLIALLFLGPGEREVVTVTVAGLVGQQQQGWQLLTAGAIISMLVPVAVFIGLQRYFVRGLTAGSVKG